MSWRREYETKCDAYELNIDPITSKKKWTKRGINGDLILYSNIDHLNDIKVRFELFQIQIWWKVFNPKLKKKGSKTRVVTFKRLSTTEQTKETIALRFKNPQSCQSFIAKWGALTRDLEYESTDDDDTDDEEHKRRERYHYIHDEVDEVQQQKPEADFIKIADKSSFRDLIKLNRLPSIRLIDSDEILSEYYFNYNVKDEIEIKKNQINYANYSYGKYNKEEHYLALWMNSQVLRRVFLTQYKRPKVNIVIVLDKSESMKESLTVNERTRMEIAQEALKQLVRHSLDKQDRIGIVTFNERAVIEANMTLIDSLPYGMVQLRKLILSFKPSGTTNMERAFKKAVSLFTDDLLSDTEYYNRIIFMTDLQLDRAKREQYNARNGIFGMIKDAAEKKRIYTTFMSMGVGIDEELFRPSLYGVRGCNYLTVHNKQEFISKFHKEQEFPYMIRPILYDLKVKLNAKIPNVYSNNIDTGDIKNGELLQIKSMFGNLNYSLPLIIKFVYVKGLRLNIGFTDKDGKRHESVQDIDLTFTDDTESIYTDNKEDDKSELVQQNDFYESVGIRKVVLLCRYIDMLREWIKVDGKSVEKDADSKLIVSSEFKQKFTEFAQYFEKEMHHIDDKTLQKELDVLRKLAIYQDTIDID